MTAAQVVLATRNKGKIAELGALLAPMGVEIVGMDAFPEIPEIEETGTTFEQNARLKAVAVCATTGLAAIADDSGLEVDALNNAPGVYSARYSATPEKAATDASNVAKLLVDLEDVPDAARLARFRCCIVACAPDGREIVAQGGWEGCIVRVPQGSNGFGYDPVFYDAEAGCTAAQMTPEQKNAKSHRAAAVKELIRQWPAFMRHGL